MVGAEDAGAVGEVLLEQVDGFVKPAGVLLGAGEMALVGQCVQGVGAEDVGVGGRGLCVSGAWSVESAAVSAGFGEEVA